MAIDEEIKFRRIGRSGRIALKLIIMKNRLKLILLLVMATIAWSCNETAKKDGDSQKEVAKTKKAEKKNKQDELLERLKNTAPVNVADLEAWLPKVLGGVPLNFSKPGPPLFRNSSQIMGNYLDEGSKKSILLLILDTAGPEGEMYASKNNMYGRLKTNIDVDGMVMRSVSVKDIGAEQTYIQKKNNTQLLFAKHERFMIKVIASNFNVEETWALVDELNFKTLNSLAN